MRGIHRRHVAILEKYCRAKAALQLGDFRVKAGEIEVVVRERQIWARQQRAKCEWLSESVQQLANSLSDSQLAVLKRQV